MGPECLAHFFLNQARDHARLSSLGDQSHLVANIEEDVDVSGVVTHSSNTAPTSASQE
jgi:hypothetical protein